MPRYYFFCEHETGVTGCPSSIPANSSYYLRVICFVAIVGRSKGLTGIQRSDRPPGNAGSTSDRGRQQRQTFASTMTSFPSFHARAASITCRGRLPPDDAPSRERQIWRRSGNVKKWRNLPVDNQKN